MSRVCIRRYHTRQFSFLYSHFIQQFHGEDYIYCMHLFKRAIVCRFYAVAALNLSVRQQKELKACWNSVYRKIFGFHKWKSVKCCIHMVLIINICLVLLGYVEFVFYRNAASSSCFLLRCTVWSFLVADVLTVYMKHCDVLSSIWDDFRLSAR